jgi:hypothetical protein
MGATRDGRAIHLLMWRVLGVRVAVILFIMIGDWIVPDYDTSTGLIERTGKWAEGETSLLDRFLVGTLRPLAHWDAVYFSDISRYLSYGFEHMHAFFPGLPIAIYLFRSLLGAGGLL